MLRKKPLPHSLDMSMTVRHEATISTALPRTTLHAGNSSLQLPEQLTRVCSSTVALQLQSKNFASRHTERLPLTILIVSLPIRIMSPSLNMTTAHQPTAALTSPLYIIWDGISRACHISLAHIQYPKRWEMAPMPWMCRMSYTLWNPREAMWRSDRGNLITHSRPEMPSSHRRQPSTM